MQDRLMRSRHDRMVAGVCGGLGKYFDIDPTIVRLVMVMLIFTGIGPLLYGAMWLVMPSELPGTGPLPPAAPPGLGNQWSQTNVPPASYGPPATPVSTDSGRFRFDPYTGQPLPFSQSDVAPVATGQTVQLESEPDPVVPPPYTQYQPAPLPYAARRRNGKPVLGIILVGVGVMAFASQIGIDSFIFPLLLIGLGIVLLMRQGRRQP